MILTLLLLLAQAMPASTDVAIQLDSLRQGVNGVISDFSYRGKASNGASFIYAAAVSQALGKAMVEFATTDSDTVKQANIRTYFAPIVYSAKTPASQQVITLQRAVANLLVMLPPPQ